MKVGLCPLCLCAQRTVRHSEIPKRETCKITHLSVNIFFPYADKETARTDTRLGTNNPPRYRVFSDVKKEQVMIYVLEGGPTSATGRPIDILQSVDAKFFILRGQCG